ncbi:hypothetical protein KKB99_00345, partial [bacterium]|nr:hypothetical protein [bacterium]MBU1024434.1 hypothetical protein [bacterium]
IMVPGVTSTAVTDTNPTPVSGTPRNPADPLIYSMQIANSANASPGDYTGLVKVLDTYSPGQNTNPLLLGMDGVGRVKPSEGPLTGLFAITEFATYQVFKVFVDYGCGPITGQVDTPSCPILTFVSGETQSFQVSASSARGGGNIILYEIDYDYDGVNFNVDDSNTDGNFVDAGPFVNQNCGTPPENPVTIKVAFRGTDECVPPNVMMFAACDITVDQCVVILYLYEPDPSRTSIDLTNGVDQPADPAGELDIGVCENSSEPDFDGVYFYDQWNYISRFDHNYLNSIFQAPGLLPFNDTGTHPAPDDPMPGYRLDVAENGYVISSYWDLNETMDLSSIDPLFIDPFPEGDVWVTWKPTVPRPTVIPPLGNDPWPHDPILSQVTMDSSEILENPIAHEGWDESNHVTVSSPASGDPQGPNPYAQAEDVLSVMFRYTNPAFKDPSTGYASQYFGHYPPYYDGSFYTLYHYAWELSGISADEIMGIDRSDTDWLWFAISGPINQAHWNPGGSEEILFLIDCNDPGSPGWLLDFDTTMEALLGYTIDGSILDLECIPYDSASPVIFDDGTGSRADQFAAIAAVLHENKHIYLIAFDDSIPGSEAFILFQDIDGSSAITGTPKHIDVGETTLDIHVTSTDGAIAYATVFTLTVQ